ncbi:MAG: hypothetical protein WC675_05880 [Patescibacteria group bacterium]|jgi:hypothetical protein
MGKKTQGHDATLDIDLDWLLQRNKWVIAAVRSTETPSAAERAALDLGTTDREAKNAVRLAQLRRDHPAAYKNLMAAYMFRNCQSQSAKAQKGGAA